MNTRGTALKLSILTILAVLALAGAGWVNYQLASQGLGGRAFVVQYTAIRGLLMEKAVPSTLRCNIRAITAKCQPACARPEHEARSDQ